MPKLNDIRGIAKKETKKALKVPVTVVCKELKGKVTEYNLASDAAKAAKDKMEKIAPELIAEGLGFIFEHNCEHPDIPETRIKSVNLQDCAKPEEGKEPETIQCTWTTKPLKCDVDSVVAGFADLKDRSGKPVDINKYTEWRIEADFDKEVFLDAKGRFMQDRFDTFRKALDLVSDALKIENPLTFSKRFTMTDQANDIRFQQLDAVTNLELHTVLPTTTTLKPLRPKSEEE